MTPSRAQQIKKERMEKLIRDLEESLKKPKGKTSEEKKETSEQIILPAENNPEEFIFLQGKTHKDYSYPDTLVSMNRLGMSPEVEKVGKELGYNLSNTAKESSGRDYIGNINWKNGLTLNLKLGGLTLSPRQFEDFILLLKSGNALDGTGKKIPESKLTEILDEITEVREPWRAEWLDADFKYATNKLWIYSSHLLDTNGNLNPNYKKELETCLMTKGTKINLRTMNHQGMPIEAGDDFYYWCPDKDNSSVARFVADSDWVFLICGRNPQDVYPSLGVRFASFQRS